MSKILRTAWSNLLCTACSGEVKEIIYGLPDPENFDFQKYEVGGCCVTSEDDKYKCSNCEFSW
jgi:hypothetical protein